MYAEKHGPGTAKLVRTLRLSAFSLTPAMAIVGSTRMVSSSTTSTSDSLDAWGQACCASPEPYSTGSSRYLAVRRRVASMALPEFTEQCSPMWLVVTVGLYRKVARYDRSPHHTTHHPTPVPFYCVRNR